VDAIVAGHLHTGRFPHKLGVRLGTPSQLVYAAMYRDISKCLHLPLVSIRKSASTHSQDAVRIASRLDGVSDMGPALVPACRTSPSLPIVAERTRVGDEEPRLRRSHSE
jgi:hypothetical protein